MSGRKLFAVSTAVKKTLTQMSSHQNNCCCCVRTYVHPQSLNTSHSCCLLIQPSLCFRSLQSLLELINRQDIVNYIPAKISNGFGAAVVVQLVERLLPIPEVRDSNPVIGKNLFIYWTICSLSTVYWKDKNKEKEARMAHYFKRKKISNGYRGQSEE